MECWSWLDCKLKVDNMFTKQQWKATCIWHFEYLPHLCQSKKSGPPFFCSCDKGLITPKWSCTSLPQTVSILQHYTMLLFCSSNLAWSKQIKKWHFPNNVTRHRVMQISTSVMLKRDFEGIWVSRIILLPIRVPAVEPSEVTCAISMISFSVSR